MPKDEADLDDPMELTGVVCATDDERGMVLALVDEYVRLGHSPEELVALFLNPRYVMTHRIFKRHGEAWVRACVDDVLNSWTRRD